MHGSSNIFFSVHTNLCFLATCVFVGVDVTVGVLRGCLGVFVCVQKQIQDPSQSIASLTRVNPQGRAPPSHPAMSGHPGAGTYPAPYASMPPQSPGVYLSRRHETDDPGPDGTYMDNLAALLQVLIFHINKEASISLCCCCVILCSS